MPQSEAHKQDMSPVSIWSQKHIVCLSVSPSQEAESNYQCRHHQLKDLILSEMQQLTNYPLLLDNIIKHTDGISVSTYLCVCWEREESRISYNLNVMLCDLWMLWATWSVAYCGK